MHACSLSQPGLLNAIAIAFHNLPEGLATFVATLASPSTGIAMVVAIMLHNIPEVGFNLLVSWVVGH